MKVCAPGKLILSGEHAVVYGKPALAMAVNRYVTATVTRERVPQILFDLSDLAHHSRLSARALCHLKDKIKNKYYRFVRGDYSVRNILHKPFELAQFALGLFAESLDVSLPQGMRIRLQSDIPIGCGMGSSAATILSVMQAISSYLHISISTEALFQLALQAENMQHGHSSGLDLRVALLGGCLYVYGEKIEKRPVPSLSLYLVNSGTPMTTTGECVESVSRYFKTTCLGDDFAAVTMAMDKALQTSSQLGVMEAIRQNHHLLKTIGVVPERVSHFISAIEGKGGAAKICGAGAVAGDKAGMVLIHAQNKEVIQPICQRYGYELLPIAGESRGVHVG